MTELVRPNGTVGVPVPLAGGGGSGLMQAVAVVGRAYQLATAQALVAQAGSPAAPTAGSTTGVVSRMQGGSYLWAVVIAGTSPSIVLQALGPDATTWFDVATRTASGVQGVVIGEDATVRLYNASANAATISSSLS